MSVAPVVTSKQFCVPSFSFLPHKPPRYLEIEVIFIKHKFNSTSLLLNCLAIPLDDKKSSSSPLQFKATESVAPTSLLSLPFIAHPCMQCALNHTKSSLLMHSQCTRGSFSFVSLGRVTLPVLLFAVLSFYFLSSKDFFFKTLFF